MQLHSLKPTCAFIHPVYRLDVTEGKFFPPYLSNDVRRRFVLWSNGGRSSIGRKGLKNKIENVIKRQKRDGLYDLIADLSKKITYRHSVMHDGRKFIVHVKLIDFPWLIFLEPDTHARGHIGVDDVDVVVSVRKLMFMDKTNGVPDFMQI